MKPKNLTLATEKELFLPTPFNPFTSIFPDRQQLINPVKSKWILFIVSRVFYCIFIAPAGKWEMQIFRTQPSLIVSFNFKNYIYELFWRSTFMTWACSEETDGVEIL